MYIYIIKIIPGFDQKCGIAFHFVMIPKKGRGFQLGFEGRPIFRSGSLLSVGRAKWHLERSTMDLRCKILHNVNPR